DTKNEIEYLYANADAAGLFGWCDTGATLKNLTISETSYVEGERYAAAVVAYGGRESIVEDCTSHATVLATGGNGHAGGIIALGLSGSVVGCQQDTGTVAATGSAGEAGGISGGTSGLVERCANGSAVTGSQFAAGIRVVGGGQLEYHTLSCVNTGTVAATSGDSEAIAAGIDISGGFGAKVYDCYNAAPVSTGTSGLAAAIAQIDYETQVVGCFYAADLVDPGVSAFGSTSYAGVKWPTGYSDAVDRAQGVSSMDLKSWGGAYALGHIRIVPDDYLGYVINTVDSTSDMHVWRMAKDDTENGGYPVLIDLYGEGFEQDGTTPTSTMQKAADWGQVGAWVENFLAPESHRFNQAISYEAFENADDGTFADGVTSLGYKPQVTASNGTPDAPVELSNPEALAWLSHVVNNKHDELTGATYANADGDTVEVTLGSLSAKIAQDAPSTISLAGSNYLGGDAGAKLKWVPIGSYEYKGSFDGTGHEIDDMASDQGLFGTLLYGDLKNVGIGSNSSASMGG
ncbi:MAG: hypothetical protein ACLSVD_19635, partial [Eggerthellaceae bacterium]